MLSTERNIPVREIVFHEVKCNQQTYILCSSVAEGACSLFGAVVWSVACILKGIIYSGMIVAIAAPV